MGLVCLLFLLFFWGGGLPVFMPIGWRATNNYVLWSWLKYSWADDMVQVAKNKMWASEVCSACLTWLYGLFVRRLISLTNAFAGYRRSTLKFYWAFFGLGSVVQPPSWTPSDMYLNELWNELYNFAQMYRNVLQMARVHWRVPVLSYLKCSYSRRWTKTCPFQNETD